MKINVTAKDISLGKPYMCACCPIALALRSKFKNKLIKVIADEFSVDHIDYELPIKAQNFITRFDHGMKVKPFSFTVRGLK